MSATTASLARRTAAPTRRTVTDHDQHVYDLAYTTWAGAGERNITRTAAILTTTHGVTVPRRTLQNWVAGVRGEPWMDRLIRETTARLAALVAGESGGRRGA